MKNNIWINVFGYENGLNFSIYVSHQTFENFMDSLLIADADKSHYVYIQDFDRFISHKTKQKKKRKSVLVRIVYSALVVKICWQNIKKIVWALMVHNL